MRIKFEVDEFCDTEKVLWNFTKENVVREYKTMHDENFLSSSSRKDERRNEESQMKVSEKHLEGRDEHRKREEEKEQEL